MAHRLLLVLLLSCGPMSDTLRAQIAGGNVSGVVTDPSGAAIPRARVVLKRDATQIARTLPSNADGFFSAPNLAPGEYGITVSAAGFVTQMAHFTLEIGAEKELNFALRIGALEQDIEVQTPPAGVDLATATTAFVV